MIRSPFLAISLWACTLGAGPAWLQGEAVSSDVSYPGTCDASAAIAIDSEQFVIASDEDNVLRIYRQESPEAPVVQDITGFLALPNPKKEADIEGSARLGDTLFFITSHGRNKDGEIKRNRYQFFALKVRNAGPAVHFEKAGRPYTRLLEDMLEEKSLKRFALDPLTPEVDAARAPEKAGATNIEGLCAWRKDQLLVAFRNPVPGGKALLVPMLNPLQVIQGEKARFGEPIRLNLGGLGIRSIEPWGKQRGYLIAAGPFDDHGSFQLYRWLGNPTQQPRRVEGVNLSDLSPEAILVDPIRGELQLLSDDGERQMGDRTCKESAAPQRKFRSRRVSPPE
jgi:hypothetical protein